MGLIEIVFSAVLNILSTFIAFKIIDLFIEKKNYDRFKIWFVEFFVWAVNYGVYYFCNNKYITSWSLVVLLFIATIIAYKGSILAKIIAVFSNVALGVVVEECVWRCFSFYGLAEEMELFGGVITSVVLLILILVLERFVSVKKDIYITNESYINILLVLLGNVLLIYLLAELRNENRVKVLLSLIIICIIDISTFWIHDKVNEVYREKIERSIMEEQILMYNKQLQIIQLSQKKIQSFRHDIKNHLLILYSYLDEGKNDRAKSYIAEMQNNISIPEQYVKTGNNELDAILNYSLSKAKKLGCQTETKISVPDNIIIQGYEMVVLFGNLLDNALEALEKVENRYLYVGITVDKGVLLIRIKNTFDGKMVQKNGIIKTRKKEAKLHGIGLRNVREIVEKYNGKFDVNIRDNYFIADVLMYIK